MNPTISPRLFICLGRTGDIINLLPVLLKESESLSDPVLLMVAQEFASILEGCSYVKPVIWRGPWQNCIEAEAAARSGFPDHEIVNCCVYGIDYRFKRESANYQREQWRLSLTPHPWGHLPLVFDLRDRERELRQFPARKGHVVTCFSGVSTPFPMLAARAIIDDLERSGFEVVDVSTVRAEFFFDLLGLIETALCVVCSDSALLHLTAATGTPVVSLIQDQSPRWQRSEWRPQHVGRIYYSEAIVAPKLVSNAVALAHLADRLPRFVHAHCFRGVVNAETHRRMKLALSSWDQEADWSGRWIDCQVKRVARDSSSVYGEAGAAPFYRDVIDEALKLCRPQDVVVLSNSDVGVTPGFTGWLVDALIRSGAAFTHRWDSDVKLHEIPRSEDQVAKLKWYPGSDCWAFTVSWWRMHGWQFPDMVMGREAGDMVLRHVVKLGHGVEIPYAIWHEKHPSYWEHWGHKDSLPANLQNRVLATEFLRVRNLSWNDGVEVRP